MHKLIPLFTFLLPLFLSAQAPQGLNYQATAWDKNNLPKINRTITVTFNVRTLKIDGSIEYTETQTSTTNEQGYFNLIIGSVRPEEFKKINWANGPKFLEVIVDGVATGTTQMMSVPYALYAENTNLKVGSDFQTSNKQILNAAPDDPFKPNSLGVDVNINEDGIYLVLASGTFISGFHQGTFYVYTDNKIHFSFEDYPRYQYSKSSESNERLNNTSQAFQVLSLRSGTKISLGWFARRLGVGLLTECEIGQGKLVAIKLK